MQKYHFLLLKSFKNTESAQLWKKFQTTSSAQLCLAGPLLWQRPSWALSVFWNFFVSLIKNDFLHFYIKLIWLGAGYLKRTGAEIGYLLFKICKIKIIFYHLSLKKNKKYLKYPTIANVAVMDLKYRSRLLLNLRCRHTFQKWHRFLFSIDFKSELLNLANFRPLAKSKVYILSCVKDNKRLERF